jgi:hypothetical protein
MSKSQNVVLLVLGLCGLTLTLLGLRGVNGFLTDLVTGATTTGYPAQAPEVVVRATAPGRYWFLMAAWLQHFVFGLITLAGFAFVWRARRDARKEEPR